MPRRAFHASLFLLAAFVSAEPAGAANGVHRCVGSAGEPVFTDRSCADLSLPDPVRDTAPAGLSERGTCATSAGQLRDRVARAFARRDAIALSGLYLWQGYGAFAAESGLRELAARVHEQLLELRIEPGSPEWPAFAPIGDSDAEADAAGQSSSPLELHVTTSSGARNAISREVRIALVERSGCWWLERP